MEEAKKEKAKSSGDIKAKVQTHRVGPAKIAPTKKKQTSDPNINKTIKKNGIAKPKQVLSMNVDKNDPMDCSLEIRR